jgi:hypothetical protein
MNSAVKIILKGKSNTSENNSINKALQKEITKRNLAQKIKKHSKVQQTQNNKRNFTAKHSNLVIDIVSKNNM